MAWNTDCELGTAWDPTVDYSPWDAFTSSGSGVWACTTASKKNGTYGLHSVATYSAGSQHAQLRNTVTDDEMWSRLWWRATAMGLDASHGLWGFGYNGIDQGLLVYNDAGTHKFYSRHDLDVGGTQYNIHSAIVESQWYLVELHHVLSDGGDNGEFECWLDGVNLFSYTGLDNDAQTPSFYKWQTQATQAGESVTYQMDDLYLDETGRIYPPSYSLTYTDSESTSLSDTLTVSGSYATGTMQNLSYQSPKLSTMIWTGGTALAWEYRAAQDAVKCAAAPWTALSSGSTGMDGDTLLDGRIVQFRIPLVETLSLGALTVNYTRGLRHGCACSANYGLSCTV